MTLSQLLEFAFPSLQLPTEKSTGISYIDSEKKKAEEEEQWKKRREEEAEAEEEEDPHPLTLLLLLLVITKLPIVSLPPSPFSFPLLDLSYYLVSAQPFHAFRFLCEQDGKMTEKGNQGKGDLWNFLMWCFFLRN